MTDTAAILGKVHRMRGRLSLPACAIGGGVQSLAGVLLVALPVVLAASLGLVGYASHGSDTAIGIAVGAAGFVAMSEALILAARPRLLESLFGGLDRMYRAHKWLAASISAGAARGSSGWRVASASRLSLPGPTA